MLEMATPPPDLRERRVEEGRGRERGGDGGENAGLRPERPRREGGGEGGKAGEVPRVRC